MSGDMGQRVDEERRRFGGRPAVVLSCALALLAAPPAGAVYAHHGPGKHDELKDGAPVGQDQLQGGVPPVPANPPEAVAPPAPPNAPESVVPPNPGKHKDGAPPKPGKHEDGAPPKPDKHDGDAAPAPVDGDPPAQPAEPAVGGAPAQPHHGAGGVQAPPARPKRSPRRLPTTPRVPRTGGGSAGGAGAQRGFVRSPRVSSTPANPSAAVVPAAKRPRAPASRARRARPVVAERLQRTTVHKPDPAPQSVVTRTVANIVHVIPKWAQALNVAVAVLLAAAALLVVAAVLRAMRRVSRHSAALHEQVGSLQAALLPEVPERLGALAVSVAYRPAEGLAAGGDFYDAFPLEGGRAGIVVGDVSGHGRASLAPATAVRHMVRSYLEAGLEPRAALQLAGKVVDDHRGETFATVVAAVHDPSSGTLSYAAAGHPPPIVAGTAAGQPLTVASSPPIGVGGITGLRQTTLPLAPGGIVCFFTDGLIEARSNGSVYGLPRLERTVRELGPEASAQDLVDCVALETDRFADDIAVCLVRADGDPRPATDRVEEIEVTGDELWDERLRPFLEACGLDSWDIDRVTEIVAPQVAATGSCLLRVSIGEGGSDVELSPARAVNGRPAPLVPQPEAA